MSHDPIGQLEFLSVIGLTTGLLIVFRRKIADWLIGNLRGRGPRPPSHPLPANDGFILRRRKRSEPGC